MSMPGFTYLGIIHRKTREVASLWPILVKPEKASLSPIKVNITIHPILQHGKMRLTVEQRLAQSHH